MKQDKQTGRHDTHKSLQGKEEKVKVSGDGFGDAAYPKKPITDNFYRNVSNK